MKIETNKDDISSFSNFQDVKQKEVYLDVSIDFNKKEMNGIINITFEIINENIEYIILDLKGPKIKNIFYFDEDAENIPMKFQIITDHEYKDSLGTPLVINYKDFINENKEEYEKIKENKKIIIQIKFITDSNCGAIQFLTKEQTNSKKYPFMFTQCEAIQCRTLFPCQDSPSQKATYEVKTSIESPLTFLFSGIITSKYYDSESKKNVIIFEQKIPIPSYLVSFVAGELEYGRISERCGVWTEKGLNKIACNEFKDAEEYIKIAEEYFKHPYEWKIYNLLVLPFSFPYGGMENPNLTFVTPSLLAGDRSMSNVIGHEIAHSWTGNLVTNKNWENFWVNEGFTTFMERKLDGKLLGDEMEKLEAYVGNNELEADIKIMGINTSMTSLTPDYTGIDPDDGFSSVPYEKGYQFLIYLEELVGKENFQEIMHLYIEKYKYQSVDYTAFKSTYENYVRQNFNKKGAKKILDKINWKKNLTEKGMTSNKIKFESKYFKEIDDLYESFMEEKQDPKEALIKFKNWHTNVKLVFLNKILDNISEINENIIKSIKNDLELAENYNSEVKYIWYQISLKKNCKDEINNIKNFLKSIGRLKYIRPLYYTWIESNQKDAKKYFDNVKMLYHPFARRVIQEKFNNLS